MATEKDAPSGPKTTHDTVCRQGCAAGITACPPRGTAAPGPVGPDARGARTTEIFGAQPNKGGRESRCCRHRPSKGLDMSVWFITGASRGFGLEITKEALARGDSVVATARNPQAVQDAIPDGGDRLLSLGLDVGVPEQVRAAVDAAAERFGRIDVLVNNAGRGLVGAVVE